MEISTFQADNTLRDEHLKLFARVDRLVETDRLKLEAKGLTPYDNLDIKDPKVKKREIKILTSCPQVTTVYKPLEKIV